MALVSAHRGGSGDSHTAQNTVAAFEAAIAVGCDYVEFDVRLTADGTPVIFHDDGLEAGETLRSIARHRLDELADVAPLTLDRVLDVVAGRVKAHVDLKVRSDDLRLTQQVVAAGLDRRSSGGAGAVDDRPRRLDGHDQLPRAGGRGGRVSLSPGRCGGTPRPGSPR